MSTPSIWNPNASATNTGVPDLAYLSGVQIPVALSGALVFVDDDGSGNGWYYYFDANSSAPVDGYSVVSTFLGGNTRWLRFPTGTVAPSGPAGGDLGGTYPNPVVMKLTGNGTVLLNANLRSSSGAYNIIDSEASLTLGDPAVPAVVHALNVEITDATSAGFGVSGGVVTAQSVGGSSITLDGTGNVTTTAAPNTNITESIYNGVFGVWTGSGGFYYLSINDYSGALNLRDSIGSTFALDGAAGATLSAASGAYMTLNSSGTVYAQSSGGSSFGSDYNGNTTATSSTGAQLLVGASQSWLADNVGSMLKFDGSGGATLTASASLMGIDNVGNFYVDVPSSGSLLLVGSGSGAGQSWLYDVTGSGFNAFGNGNGGLYFNGGLVTVQGLGAIIGDTAGDNISFDGSGTITSLSRGFTQNIHGGVWSVYGTAGNVSYFVADDTSLQAAVYGPGGAQLTISNQFSIVDAYGASVASNGAGGIVNHITNSQWQLTGTVSGPFIAADDASGSLSLTSTGVMAFDPGGLSFFRAPGISQAAAIANADGTLADITAKFNTLLAVMRTTTGYGLIAG